MARLRFFKPKLVYRMRRLVRGDGNVHFDWVTESIRRLCHRGTRSEVLLIRLDSAGIETVAFHTADPNDLSDDLRRIHQVVSRRHREATGIRAPWRGDRYEATPVHETEVLLRILKSLLLDAGPNGERPTVLVGGIWPFATWELDLLGESLVALGVDPERVERWLDEVAAADVELGGQVMSVDGETHAAVERSRRDPWTDWDIEAGSEARLAYAEEEADAQAAYRSAADDWRRGVAAARVPPEMMPSHLLRTGVATVRLPLPELERSVAGDVDAEAAAGVGGGSSGAVGDTADRGGRSWPDAVG